MRYFYLSPNDPPFCIARRTDEELAAATARSTDMALLQDHRLLCLYRDRAHDDGDTATVQARDRQLFFVLAEARRRGLALDPVVARTAAPTPAH